MNAPTRSPLATNVGRASQRDAAAVGRLEGSIRDYYHVASTDLFEKCRRFHDFADRARALGLYQSRYRLVLRSPLDHRITVVDPFSGKDRQMICFDSNSYLGLHLHPRVKAAVKQAVDTMGIGTPSAQVLGGTNRFLVELEELLCLLHDRDEALVFPSGYQANIGILTGLLRQGDAVFADEFAHASIHDGCRYSGAAVHRYPHRDVEVLDTLLTQQAPEEGGMLIVTDGLFSMHGDLAPLPELREVADRHRARLMVDDAHSLGIIGATGKGIEEHFAMEGSVDVFMGTFSKAPGAIGGYVCGDAAVIEYLRFFAHGSTFTAALPAATCAGLAEALRVMHDEPEHRERLWANARRLWQGLHQAGLRVRPLESPIVVVTLGAETVAQAWGRDLFEAGIKCGVVEFPAVLQGESILRMTVNARHTQDDIDYAVEVLAALGRRYGSADRHGGPLETKP